MLLLKGTGPGSTLPIRRNDSDGKLLQARFDLPCGGLAVVPPSHVENFTPIYRRHQEGQILAYGTGEKILNLPRRDLPVFEETAQRISVENVSPGPSARVATPSLILTLPLAFPLRKKFVEHSWFTGRGFQAPPELSNAAKAHWSQNQPAIVLRPRRWSTLRES